jgi:hypothetical protein
LDLGLLLLLTVGNLNFKCARAKALLGKLLCAFVPTFGVHRIPKMIPFTFSKCKPQVYQSYLLVRSSSFITSRKAVGVAGSGFSGNRCGFSTLQVAALTSSRFLDSASFVPTNQNTLWQRKHSFSSATSKEEEEKEKYRVSMLSPEQRKQELRELDRKIKDLNTLRGINTGELYTWRGQMKALARDYGIGMSQR